MLGADWEIWGVIALVAFVAAALTQWALTALTPTRRVSWTSVSDMDERTVFLFEDEDLVDATPEANALLRAGPEQLTSWHRLMSVLERRFPDCSQALARIREAQHLSIPAEDGGALLIAEWRGGLTRIAVSAAEDVSDTGEVDRSGYRALNEELETLRAVVDHAPMLVWRENADGAVDWANSAYFQMVRALSETHEPVSWPLPKLFAPQLADQSTLDDRRLSLKLPNTEAPLWYQVQTWSEGDQTMVHAVPVDKLVKTEASLREFIQTLTKTFAHLPTGLAVFDRGRRLALFNPALTDLSALEPQFLSSRPTLYEFLDRLRERQRMPEPKDYKTWRRRISDMEAAAATGTHQETWSLPNGQTFRVTGRPHPEGALAFLFEDISAEITSTRRFRAELELGQSILDSLDEAIAVFSSSGALMQTNAAYGRLWGVETDSTLEEVNLLEALRFWSGHCVQSDIWSSLREHAVRTHRKARWHGQVALLDGRQLLCQFAPLQGNACRVSFFPVQSSALAGIDQSAPLALTSTAAE